MKWKCKQSGNIIETHSPHDDENMSGHDGYELVVEEAVKPEDKKPVVKKTKD